MNLNLRHLLYTLLLISVNNEDIYTEAQRTSLDVQFGGILKLLRSSFLNVMGGSGDDIRNVELHQHRGKSQKTDRTSRTTKEFCDPNGPGKRSEVQPTSVHRLRPGDIDIVAAMGDSLTAGNGIVANNIFQVGLENRGMAWSIGGQGNWQQYVTFPNLLKEYNPNLYGYALKDSLGWQRSSKFNVAELGAMSRDMPYMATVLVKRLTHDPHVNMTHHWKVITLLIGNNDFCSDVCFYPDPMKAIEDHERNMLKTYRYLRDNVPRLMLNVVPAPNLMLLTKMSGLPAHCYSTLTIECPCIIGKSKQQHRFMDNLMEKWVERDIQIVNRDEFNTETFTINIQHFTKDFVFPQLANGETDTSYASEDCFHISQRGQAASANSYWNNLFEMPGEKSSFNTHIYDHFKCPTVERPFIMTRINSREDFKL